MVEYIVLYFTHSSFLFLVLPFGSAKPSLTIINILFEELPLAIL